MTLVGTSFHSYTAAECGRAQAINDMTIFAVGLACSLSAGALLQGFGWQMLNILLLPWLGATALALAWLTVSGGRRAGLVATPFS